jgi:hypothetical protein
MMLSFAAIPVSAEVKPDYTLDISDRDLNADFTAKLFPGTEDEPLYLYPGEIIESTIKIENDTASARTVVMTVRKGGTNVKNLADFIWLNITRDGSDEKIYSGSLADIENTVKRIEFPVAETAIYRFSATFGYDEPGKPGKTAQEISNDLMGGSADFQVIFTVITPGGPLFTFPGGSSFEGGGSEYDIPAGPIPAAQGSPALAQQSAAPVNQPAVNNAETPAPEVPEAAQPEQPEEYYDFDEGGVPQVGTNPDEEPEVEDEPEAEEPDEEVSTLEDNRIPLAAPEFIAKMPKTGEKTNPMTYQMTGLAFVFAGGLAIVGVNRKSKEKE